MGKSEQAKHAMKKRGKQRGLIQQGSTTELTGNISDMAAGADMMAKVKSGGKTTYMKAKMPNVLKNGTDLYYFGETTRGAQTQAYISALAAIGVMSEIEGNRAEKRANRSKAFESFAEFGAWSVSETSALGLTFNIEKVAEFIMATDNGVSGMLSAVADDPRNTAQGKILLDEIDRLTNKIEGILAGMSDGSMRLPTFLVEPVATCKAGQLFESTVGDDRMDWQETLACMLYSGMLKTRDLQSRFGLPVYATSLPAINSILRVALLSVIGCYDVDECRAYMKVQASELSENFEKWLNKFAEIRGETWREDYKRIMRVVDMMPTGNLEAMGHYDRSLLDFYNDECKAKLEYFFKGNELFKANERGTLSVGEYKVDLANRIAEHTNHKYDAFMEVVLGGHGNPLGTDDSGQRMTLDTWMAGVSLAMSLYGLADTLGVGVTPEEKLRAAHGVARTLMYTRGDMFSALEERNKDSAKELDTARVENEHSKKRAEDAETKYKNIRRQMKNLETSEREHQGLVAKLEREILQLKSGRDQQGHVETYERLLEKARQETEDVKGKYATTAKKLGEAEKAKEKAEETAKKALEIQRKAEERLAEAGKRMNEFKTDAVKASVPLDCYIEALNGKKIVIAGGESAHPRLKQYLPKAKLLGETDVRRAEQLSGYDLVIIVQAENKHKMDRRLDKEAKGVKRIITSVTSAEAIVLEAFKGLYS